MTRIDKLFSDLKKSEKKAFIAFITAGYPDLNATKKLILAFDRIGVDLIELGVPFSDPLADGPVIQEASQYALKNKVNLTRIMEAVKEVRPKVSLPICLMTYYNPVFCFGEERFAARASRCGVDGVIIPDLPPEEGAGLSVFLKNNQVDNISFIAPTSSTARMRYIARISRGFIYYVSLTGVTGERAGLPKDMIGNIRKIKRLTDKPVCVGFGVSNNRQVREVQKVADGVIVGSAIVRKIKDNIGKSDLVDKVSGFVRQLKK